MMGNSDWKNRPEKIYLFLVDRNRFFRQGVRSALAQNKDIEVLGESDMDDGVFDLIKATRPQIVLVDIDPPVLSGIDLTRQIIAEIPGTSVVVMTPYHNDDELVHATIAGGTAYLSKDIEDNELATLIRRIADGELLIVESLLSKSLVLERVLRHFQDLLLKGRTSNSKDGPITEREAEVLSYVACGYGNKQIANALGISEQTIKNHMTSIMDKLDANDRTHAVVMAMKYGWISTSAKAKWNASSTSSRHSAPGH